MYYTIEVNLNPYIVRIMLFIKKQISFLYNY